MASKSCLDAEHAEWSISCVNVHAALQDSMSIVLHHMLRKLAETVDALGAVRIGQMRSQRRHLPTVGRLERGMDGTQLAPMLTHSVQIALAVFIGKEYTSAAPERPRARRRRPPPPRCTAS